MARVTRDFHGLRVLTEDWPVLVIEFPERRVADAVLQDALFHLEVLLKEAQGRRERTFTITDLTRLYEFPPASQRKIAADWLARTLALQKDASLGGATVARGTMLRAFINAVHWVAPPAMPSTFVATRREAYDEAVRAFEAARAPLRADQRAAFARR